MVEFKTWLEANFSVDVKPEVVVEQFLPFVWPSRTSPSPRRTSGRPSRRQTCSSSIGRAGPGIGAELFGRFPALAARCSSDRSRSGFSWATSGGGRNRRRRRRLGCLGEAEPNFSSCWVRFGVMLEKLSRARYQLDSYSGGCTCSGITIRWLDIGSVLLKVSWLVATI